MTLTAWRWEGHSTPCQPASQPSAHPQLPGAAETVSPALLQNRPYASNKACGMQATEQKSRPQPDLSVYTFGQPRVGNIPWAEDYGEPRQDGYT